MTVVMQKGVAAFFPLGGGGGGRRELGVRDAWPLEVQLTLPDSPSFPEQLLHQHHGQGQGCPIQAPVGLGASGQEST